MGRRSQVGIHVREAEPLPPAVLPLAPFGVGKWMRRHPFGGAEPLPPAAWPLAPFGVCVVDGAVLACGNPCASGRTPTPRQAMPVSSVWSMVKTYPWEGMGRMRKSRPSWTWP